MSIYREDTQFQPRSGTTGEHATFVGEQGEFTVDITKNTGVVHDGVTPGGHPLATEQALNAHKAETMSKVLIVTEPYDQEAVTTVDLGFKPKFLTIHAVIRNSNFESVGRVDETNQQYCRYYRVDGEYYDIIAPAINLAYNPSNRISGQVTITDTGISINWTKQGTITGATGDRRLIISALTHGEG